MRNELKEILSDIEQFNWCILAGYRGSVAHGTYNPQLGLDDIDVWGIAIAPLEYYIGLKSFEQVETFRDKYDILIYDIKKYFRLLLQNNPNVLSWLWLHEGDYILRTELGERLIANRDIFLSKLCYKSFTGYAYGQLKRMTSFKKEGYMGEKRKALVEKYGYDTKNAAHLIRLLRMGIELLNTGELNVKRHDSQYLLQIKNGKFSLDYIKKEAERLFKLADEAYLRSKLPNKPDYDKAEKLLVEIVMDYHGLKDKEV